MSQPEHVSHFAGVDKSNRLFFERVCVIPEGGKIPGHPCTGDARVLAFDGFFRIPDIIAHIEAEQLQAETIALKDIWYNLHRPDEKLAEITGSERYQAADPDVPGILAPIKNPDHKPYRMLDGRRRLWKLEQEGRNEGQFYVIPRADVFRFFWMIMAESVLRRQLDAATPPGP